LTSQVATQCQRSSAYKSRRRHRPQHVLTS
jgi:hypothetical protein